jgi:hypothetical protein
VGHGWAASGRGRAVVAGRSTQSLAMSENATVCRCNRSLGAVSAIFASLAVLAFIAEDGCMDGGGRLSDVAWVCEVASGTSVSIWSLVSPFAISLVAVGIGIPVYFGANAIGGRLIAAYGRRHG